MKRSFQTPALRRTGAPHRRRAPTKQHAQPSTRNAILDAAVQVLARDGFPALTARNIAKEAGTNLALLNYYFGSKQGLLLALFDVLDQQRFARQREMYGVEDTPMSEKWRSAVAFYREDLRTGYVRVLQELTAYAYSNEAARERLVEHTRRWDALLVNAAEAAARQLELDMPPAFIAHAVGAFWLGMETRHLVYPRKDGEKYFAILDAVGVWIEQREKQLRGGKRNARA